jgi:tripartite-type tricarboxylate transporter receptor subunit TctC
MRPNSRFARAIAAALMAAGILADAGTRAAAAQSAEEFYRGRSLQLIVGYETGNDYDVGARLLARHLSKQLPGQPAVVVQNMPQASGLAAANFLAMRAPRDGSVIGSISRNLPSQAAMGLPNIEADPRRFNWLGATSFPGRICVAAGSSAMRTPQDVFERELIIGSVGVGSSTSIVPTVLNRVLGTRFRLIEGYRGAQDILLAIERGEVHGICASLGQFRSHEQKFKEGKLHIIFRAEEEPLPQLPDVPSIYAYAKTDEQRQLMHFVFSSTEFGRPYLFPPEVPAERLAFMRKALAAAVNSPELVAEAQRIKLDMTYRPPEHLERLVARLYATPPDVIAAIKKISPNLR